MASRATEGRNLPKPDEESGQEGPETQGRAPQEQALELETYLFTQRLVRQVKTATEGCLRQINEKIREVRRFGK